MGTGLAASPQASAGREHGAGAPRVTLGRTKERKCQNRRREKGIENKRPVQSALRSDLLPFFRGKYIFPSVAYRYCLHVGPDEPDREDEEAEPGSGMQTRGCQGPLGGPEPARGGGVTNTCLGNRPQVWKPMDPMDLVSSHSFL